MPRTGQIIPEWTHPHIETYINDNTFYEDTTTGKNSGPMFLNVFVGGKGRTNRLIHKESFTDFVKEYGLPDYRKWGQAMYMPYVSLYTGLATSQCMRLAADNATYSNLILVVGYKVEAGKFKLKFKTYARKGLRQLEDLDAFVETLNKTDPDADGYKYAPLMNFWCLGKGIYGDDYRIRISHDKNSDKENDYKNYLIELLSTADGSSRIESYNVSFFIDAVDPNTNLTIYIDEIVNDEEGKGSERFGCSFNYDNFQMLFDEYTKVYENNGYVAPQIDKVDRLPSITTPSASVLYHLTKDDLSRVAGELYGYDSANGKFVKSSLAIYDVATLPNVQTGSTNVIYKLTADDSGKLAGSAWVTTDNVNWAIAPAIIDVEMLPDPQTYVLGRVYMLTRDVGNKAKGSQWIFNEDVNDYISFVDNGPNQPDPLLLTMETFDIFGYNRFTKAQDPFITFEGGTEAIEIMNLEGIALHAGDDGDFSQDVAKSVREKAIETAYINAFQCGIDPKIKSKRRAPIDILLDSALPMEVKKSMVALALKRRDMSVRLDTGLASNIDDICTLGAIMADVDTFFVSKNCHMFKTVDPVTGKHIPVSITLWMAKNYPNHFYTNGNHVPMAGEVYGVVFGHDKRSFKPEIDEDDFDVKELLFKTYRINYCLSASDNKYYRGSQNTSQVKSSDLSKESNVFVLLEIKRKIEAATSKNEWNFTDDAQLRLFKQECGEIFGQYAGTKCLKCSIDVKQNMWESTRYISHIYLAVVFRSYQERGIIEIDVNPRT